MSFNGTSKMHIIGGIINAEDYMKILQEILLPSLKCLGLPKNVIADNKLFQHNNGPNILLRRQQFLKKQTIKVYDW